jgi:hypothetical protein
VGTENASIKIRNRKVELKLTFEYADHIIHNFMYYNPPHDVCFLDIQRIAKTAVYQKEHGRIWSGAAHFNGKKYRVIIILTAKFAIVKTCYYYKHA